MSKLDIEKFDGKISFAIWRVQMLAVLTQNGLKKVLAGKMMRPTTMTEEQWDEMDEKALSAIQLCLSREVLREVINEKSTAGIWSKLESLYMTKSLANKLRLKERLFTLRMSEDLGLEGCIEHVWKDTIIYLDNKDPVFIGRSYGRVSRHLLHEELLRRCVESGVSYLSSRVESIIEASNGHSRIVCEYDIVVPSRLVTVASGAASGKLLQYEVGGPKVSVQTAYGVEVEVENNPYDPNLMVFMDYRDYMEKNVQGLEANYPTFLYAMPMSRTRVFFEETCLASKDAMPFDLLKKKLFSRLHSMGIRITKTYEEEWSYIPVGGSLPNTEQKNLAFGAAASMVHPATGYSVVRSLSEAPKYASVIATILKDGHAKDIVTQARRKDNLSMQAWNTLWPQERKRQRAFFLFGLALILQLDIGGIRTFFRTFFCLPDWMWQGFLGSSLSSTDLVLFAFYMFIIAPNNLRMSLVRHLLSDPTGATMIKTYLAV